LEVAWLTDHPTAVALVNGFIENLAERATVIDERFIERILRIKVRRRRIPTGRTAHTAMKHRTWIIGVSELKRDFRDEQERIETGKRAAKEHLSLDDSDVSWIRWVGKSRFREEVRRGDSVIQIWNSGPGKRADSVLRHAPVLHRQDEPTCTRIYIEEVADEDELALTWNEFKALLKRVGVQRKISAGSIRIISEDQADALFALWHR
jgi:hypothetical protein